MKERLETGRLILHRLEADDFDAWLEGNRIDLESRTGARFPAAMEPPPLFRDDMPAIRDRLRRAGGEPAASTWLMLARSNGAAVGIAGFSRSDETVVTGYSVYPALQRMGLATEGLQALLDWLFEQSGVERVRATIPPDNAPSIRVAEKLGVQLVGKGEDPQVGEVLHYEVGRQARPNAQQASAQKDEEKAED
jgi:ribosomal-protein-alanine N-acetyltransferase